MKRQQARCRSFGIGTIGEGKPCSKQVNIEWVSHSQFDNEMRFFRTPNRWFTEYRHTAAKITCMQQEAHVASKTINACKGLGEGCDGVK
eukprot:286780-Hanusia_phi.AAC.1